MKREGGRRSAARSPDSGKLRQLNRPRPIRVRADEHGVPAEIRSRDRWRRVAGVIETWRIDDEWWRETIARAYFSLVLDGGAHLTVFHDLVDDRWYIQPE